MHPRKSTQKYTALFAAVLAGMLLFILSIFFVSANQHELYRTPEVENGILDLSGWDQRHAVALDGKWEFYWDHFIVSDGVEKVPKYEPDLYVDVPEQWSSYEMNEKKLPKNGRASYRIMLLNCPDNAELITYIPNLRASYKAYLNGQLVASSGDMSVALEERHAVKAKELNRAYSTRINWLTFAGEREMELVIEVDGGLIDGLALTPILAENEQEYFASSMRYVAASVYFGMMLLSMFVFGYILFRNYRSVQSVILFVLSLMMFVRILMKDEFFGIIESFLPAQVYREAYICLKILTILIPLMYWIYMKNLMEVPVAGKFSKAVIVYEIVCVAVVFVFVLLERPKLEYVMTCISLIPFMAVLWFCFKEIRLGSRETFFVSLCLIFLLTSIITGSLYMSGILLINISMVPPTFFLLFILTQDYIFIRRISDIQKDELEKVNLRLMLEEAERDLMLSQIKPHFLYNALIAIQVLCRQDPKKAEAAVFDFAQFLRANMSFISSHEPVPFSHELEHIRHYAAIEKLRFQERLTVVYHIHTTDFYVPPLTIQPLVENAIKHGASKRIQGGWVKLETYETENEYQIFVIDNGPGFEMSALRKKQETGSYGINNITVRLRKMMNADIRFYSSTDKGTAVLVKIPKPRREETLYDECNYSR